MQQNVRDVIAGYWNLVAARAAAWARRRQVEQADFAFDWPMRACGVIWATRPTPLRPARRWRNFARSSSPPTPTCCSRKGRCATCWACRRGTKRRSSPPPSRSSIACGPNWQELVDLAAARRPDLVELKLILEADEQQRIIANNNALPQLNGVALYRWNGLEGEMPNGNGMVSSSAGPVRRLDAGREFFRADWPAGRAGARFASAS